ncbi:restriction endonuclease subunit S [Janthinobacterium sp. 61]|uniref:restriction endonuclease subunit S n=1 Tax=Janthinobacterium sp. 61 TaxID=2035209 RepID=UPI0015D5A3A6|nr:restriction endonuclease subunit S [Janthinobacterium sp. 61]
MILTPIGAMTEQEKLWWATCITANRFRFGFGRQANRSLRNLVLPSAIPPWVYAANISSACSSTLTELKQLSSAQPQTAPSMIGTGRVRIEEIFNLTYGTSLELNRLSTNGGNVNFVARTAKNNGVAAMVVLPASVEVINGGCLTVALSGSVLETFYQREPFVTGFHIMVLRPQEPMVPEELMFYAACIRANQSRYSYGRQANRTLKDLDVPARNAIPRWVYGAISRVANQLEASGRGSPL